MPNGPNPLTAPFQAIKQIGEQANLGIQSLGTGLARTASMGIDSLMAAAPPVPGLPGGQGLPTPQSLMPANLTQALVQVENLIPAGLPRPSQLLAVKPLAPTPLAPTPQNQVGRPARMPSLASGGY